MRTCSEPRRPRISQANRGMGLENLVGHTCDWYRRRGWGCIQKIATPMRQVRRAGQEPTFRRRKSTVDFLGVYRGVPVAFDAKQTRGKAFPLDNLKDHQRVFLEDFAAAGGQAFVLIEFVAARQVFAATVEWLTDSAAKLGRVSVPLEHFETSADLGIGCWRVGEGLGGVPLHFGAVVDAAAEVPRGTQGGER